MLLFQTSVLFDLSVLLYLSFQPPGTLPGKLYPLFKLKHVLELKHVLRLGYVPPHCLGLQYILGFISSFISSFISGLYRKCSGRCVLVSAIPGNSRRLKPYIQLILYKWQWFVLPFIGIKVSPNQSFRWNSQNPFISSCKYPCSCLLYTSPSPRDRG